MDSSMPGSSVLHHLPEFAQTHVHLDSDAFLPSPLSPTSPPVLNLAPPIYLDTWTWHSKFLGNIDLYSMGLYFHHQTHPKLSLFSALAQPSWITALSWQRGLSNSMKLRAMPGRATQDRWLRVESSTKTWCPGGGITNHSSGLASRTPWAAWKGKRLVVIKPVSKPALSLNKQVSCVDSPGAP